VSFLCEWIRASRRASRDGMNALFAMEAKHSVLGSRCFRSVGGFSFACSLAALLDAGVVGRLKGISQLPDRNVVEVQTIPATGLQRFDTQYALCNLSQ
jgi:hypothetical protein